MQPPQLTAAQRARAASNREAALQRLRSQDDPPNLYQLTGDLLHASEHFIVQQCNCTSKGVSHRPMGLSDHMFRQFPHANVYELVHGATGQTSQPGSISVFGGWNGRGSGRGVVNLHAQVHPGRPKVEDTQQMREAWFEAALAELGQVDGLCSVAFPTHIGCGIAGGDWAVYREKLRAFARANSRVRVVLYDQPQAAAQRTQPAGATGATPPTMAPGTPHGAPSQARPASPAQSTASTAQYEHFDANDLDLDGF
jgi:hypothetical protein